MLDYLDSLQYRIKLLLMEGDVTSFLVFARLSNNLGDLVARVAGLAEHVFSDIRRDGELTLRAAVVYTIAFVRIQIQHDRVVGVVSPANADGRPGGRGRIVAQRARVLSKLDNIESDVCLFPYGIELEQLRGTDARVRPIGNSRQGIALRLNLETPLDESIGGAA